MLGKIDIDPMRGGNFRIIIMTGAASRDNQQDIIRCAFLGIGKYGPPLKNFLQFFQSFSAIVAGIAAAAEFYSDSGRKLTSKKGFEILIYAGFRPKSKFQIYHRGTREADVPRVPVWKY